MAYFIGEFDRDFLESRIAEVRSLLDDESLANAAVHVDRMDTVEGYRARSEADRRFVAGLQLRGCEEPHMPTTEHSDPLNPPVASRTAGPWNIWPWSHLPTRAGPKTPNAGHRMIMVTGVGAAGSGGGFGI